MINEDQLETIENVPVFSETQLGDDFNLAKLQLIVDKNNQRIAMEENPPVVIGHDDPDEDEVKKPVLGFIRQFHLGVRNGVNTIFAKLGIYKSELATLNRYPRRSIEVGEDTYLVPRLALLGGTEPALDLGLLVYQKGGQGVETEQILKYSKDKIEIQQIDKFSKGRNMAYTDEFKTSVLEVLADTDVYAFVKDLMSHVDKMDADSNVTEDDAKVASENEKKEEYSEMEQTDEGEKKVVEEEHKEVKDEEDPKKVQTEDDVEDENDDEDKANYKKYQKEVAELTLKFQKSEREKSLMRLSSEGYDFDLAVELEDSVDMNEGQFAKHVERIKRFSKMAPVNLRKFSVKTVDIGGTNGGVAVTAQAERIKEYALANKITYRKAEAILKTQ